MTAPPAAEPARPRFTTFTAIAAHVRRIVGRSERIERKLDTLLDHAQQERTMDDTLLAEARKVHEAIAAVMKSKAAEVDAAVAKAKAAWDADNAADHDAALAELQAIQAELANPPAAPAAAA